MTKVDQTTRRNSVSKTLKQRFQVKYSILPHIKKLSVEKFEYSVENSWENQDKLARKRLLNKKSSKKYREKQKVKEIQLLESVKKLQVVSTTVNFHY